MNKMLLSVGLAGAMVSAAHAIPTWSPTWHDAAYGGETFDRVEYFIVNSSASFADAPTITFDTGTPGWTGTYVNPTYTYVSGSAVTLRGAVGDMMTLYFNGTRPSQNDLRLDVLYWNGSTLVSDLCWRWLNLPNYGYAAGIQWDYIPNLNPNAYNRAATRARPPGHDEKEVDYVPPTAPVIPEGHQVPDGGPTGLLVGLGLLAMGCVRRFGMAA